MKFFRYLMLMFVAAFAVNAASAQDEQVVSWKNKVEHVKDDIYRVTFTANIASGWHIYDLGPYEGGPYATAFDFEKNANVELVGKVKLVKPTTRHFDEVWKMDIGHLDGTPSFTQDVRLKSEKATLKGLIEWQSCDEERCQPPGEYEFSIEIVRVAKTTAATAVESTGTTTAADAAVAASDGEQATDENAAEEVDTQTAAPDNDIQTTISTPEGEDEVADNFWALVLEAIIWGFVSLVTPCVFPMVPVTVSFFMKGSANKAVARLRASTFGLSIILLYTLPIAIIIFVTMMFGGDEGVAGIFNSFATHWIPNIIFFIVFMVFAASFFGAFEITIPSSLINKSDSKSEKGGLIGVFFMALTLVLVSFSCTGALVGNVISAAAKGTAVWWQPIVIMMVFSTVFAIPFTLLAFVPSLMTKLKSGSWLNTVKVSLGFVEVALGFKFLMMIDQAYLLNIFSREFYLAIWIVCGLLWGLYLLGVYKTKHDSDEPYVGPMRLGIAMTVFVVTVWMMPGMLGAPLKPLSGYMPQLGAQEFNVATAGGLTLMPTGEDKASETSSEVFINPLTGQPPLFSDMGLHTPEGFNVFFEMNEALAFAKHVGKPLFIDITGVTCTNCREMEQNVWTDPQVARMLREDFVMVCVFMDVKKNLPEEFWVVDDKGRTLKQMGKINIAWSNKNFNQVAQPLYVMMDPRSGKLLGPTRAFDRSIPDYIAWLQNGIAAFNAK